MNNEVYGLFESFRSLRADKLSAVILERCRDERRQRPAAADSAAGRMQSKPAEKQQS